MINFATDRPLSVTTFWKNKKRYAHLVCRKRRKFSAHLQSSVFKLSKDLIDSIHEEGIVAYTS